MIALYGRRFVCNDRCGSTKIRGETPARIQCSARLEVDVAILGGGVTGAMVAWRLASRGRPGRRARSGTGRPRQHRREHCPADAGARRGFFRASRPVRRPRGKADLEAQQAPLRATSSGRCAGSTSRAASRCAIRSTSRSIERVRELLARVPEPSAAGVAGRWLDAAASLSRRGHHGRRRRYEPEGMLRSILTGPASGSSTRLNAAGARSTNDRLRAGPRHRAPRGSS